MNPILSSNNFEEVAPELATVGAHFRPVHTNQARKIGSCLPPPRPSANDPHAFIHSLVLVFLILLAPWSAPASSAPNLVFFPAKTDQTGKTLQQSFVWTGDDPKIPGVVAGFRKTFNLPRKPRQATLSLFADARYLLWVNGFYAGRGPSRFQPNGPQYDVVDVTKHLRRGRNAIALVVIGNLPSSGRVMRHPPGLTAILDADGREVTHSDASWLWTGNTRYREVTSNWAHLGEKLVDTGVEDGDWTQPDYNDSSWQPSVKIDGNQWGPLTRTTIPPLAETLLDPAFDGGSKLPVELKPGEKLSCSTGRMVQAYARIEMEADAGTELSIAPYGIKYLARGGKQSHITLDTQGLTAASISVKSGRATISKFQLVERLYPYKRLGAFKCNDSFLNQLWEMCARSCELLSEDSYVDCADRERVEWMDNTPPGFDITRTAMAGPGPGSKPVYSDPRLLGQLVRRTALTLQPEGWVKAHTCSDRYDIHAKMEDRACEWVSGTRIYYEACGDLGTVKEIWPAIVSQLDYFLKARTPRGLVRARDWVVWGNPVGYVVGEATTLNVFVQKALADAAFLGEKLGDSSNSQKFAQAANSLAQAINSVLWNEQEGDYFSGYFTDADASAGSGKGKLKLPRTDGLTPSTPHANLFALDRGVVPAQRRGRVIENLLSQPKGALGRDVMLYYYLFKQLYALDTPEIDCRVLAFMRDNWQPMVASPWQCSWESLGGGSKAHIYGMFPGYFLSSYVLGVRWRDGIPLNRKLLVQPHPGDLTAAEGTVVTEAGPVPVSWKRGDSGAMEIKLKVPEAIHCVLSLPIGPKKKYTLDGKPITGTEMGNRMQFNLSAGKHTATLE